MRPGTILAHRVEGAGEPVLLLNGGMMSMAAWEPVSAGLRGHFRLIGCDLRGQLLSPGSPPATFAGHVADVVALLDHLGVPSVDVVGTSFGGEVAVLLAATHPARVAALIATTAADRFTDEMEPPVRELRLAARRAAVAGERARFFELMLEGVYSPGFLAREGERLRAQMRERAAAFPVDWFLDVDALLATLQTLDLSARLAAIDCPALVVSAEHDRIIPAARCHALAAGIRGARHVVAAGSGHALVVEQPGRLVELVLGFLSEVGPRA